MNWAAAFQGAVALLTVAAAIYATRAGQRGKKLDAEIQSAVAKAQATQTDQAQRFEELKVSLAAARTDLDYYSAQLNVARGERAAAEQARIQLQQEWVDRHRRMLERCEALAEQIETILNGPLTLPPAQRQRLEEAVEDVERHLREDHHHFD